MGSGGDEAGADYADGRAHEPGETLGYIAPAPNPLGLPGESYLGDGRGEGLDWIGLDYHDLEGKVGGKKYTKRERGGR